jgi:Rhs element Vgr protein
MADSPIKDADGVVRCVVFSDGRQLPDTAGIVSISVQRAANMIPSARLVLLDGDMPTGEFPLSDAAVLKPGARIKIEAGYDNAQQTLFEGVVVKHALQISGDNSSRLIIECRDLAAKMSVGRNNANYIDQKDSDIISTLIGAHGLTADVTATDLQYGELVQYYCSDWDFMLARAEANGLVVIVTDGKVAVKAPDTGSAAVLKVTYGLDLMEFDAEIDARTQLKQVQAVCWDPKTQQALESAVAPPAGLNEQGDLTSAALAAVLGLATYRLQSGAALPKAALTQWAKAQQLKSGLARIRGRMKFDGSAKATLGKLIELGGVGARFNGSVLVSALEHRIEGGNWWTEVHFGMSPAWFTERSDVMAPSAGGWLPGVPGLHIGVVTKLDGDPQGEQRIQVKVPVLQARTEVLWARLLQFHASNAFGACFVPEVGDEVVLGYFNNDPSHPVVLGSLYSSKHAPAQALAAQNDIKSIVTRCKSKLEFDEKNKVITVTTPGNNKVVLSDTGKSILLQDQNGNKVGLAPGGITLDSPKDIKVTAQGSITIDATGPLSLSSKADVQAQGLNVAIEAQVGFTAKGSASAELSAAGQTTVKGALVMIN